MWTEAKKWLYLHEAESKKLLAGKYVIFVSLCQEWFWRVH